MQEPTKALTDLPTKYMVAIIVACVVGALIFILIVVFYCYRRRRAQKLKKLLEMEKAHSTRPTITTQPPPPYYAGLDNKGPAMEAQTLDEAAKNALYATQNGYGYTVPNGHINNGGDCTSEFFSFSSWNWNGIGLVCLFAPRGQHGVHGAQLLQLEQRRLGELPGIGLFLFQSF